MAKTRSLWVVTAVDNRDFQPTVLTVVASREQARDVIRNVNRDNYSFVRLNKSRKIGRGIKVS